MAQVLSFPTPEERAAMRPLGEVLVAEGLVSEEALAGALERQRQEGGRLGEQLVMEGVLGWQGLAEALGGQVGIGTVDLLREPCDPALLDARARESYRQHGWLPWRWESGIYSVAAVEITPQVMQEARRWLGDVPLAFLLTSPRDIQRTLAAAFADALDMQAREDLHARFPVWSARRQPGDRWALAALFGLLGLILLSPFFPAMLEGVLIGANLMFLGSILFKWRLVAEGRDVRWPQGNLTALREDGLPVYTVLIPLYKEAASVPGILEAMAALDYPKHRLDVKLVIEADDEATLAAAFVARPPAYVEILRVPPSEPRTKPKACNYALQFARGDYVTIYDAEDRPEPDQLKKAVALFLASPPEVVCLQARLNYYNRDEKWLTRLFAIEYALLFNRMIPGLQARGIPIPLGGTSNHMALKRLRRLGGWDPFNVTEDADLGLRLAAAGLKTLPLDSLTLEEAPLTVKPWLRQRSRWIKGYLMTWIVHTRAPGRLLRHCGPVGLAGLQFLIGGASLIYLIAPLLWVICLAGLLTPGWLPEVPGWLWSFCWGTLALGILAQWQMAWRMVRDLRWPEMGLAVLGFPFYWILHSVASFRALWQLMTAPSHWEKTEHGLTRYKNRRIA